MIRRPPRSTPKPSSAASDVYKRQRQSGCHDRNAGQAGLSPCLPHVLDVRRGLRTSIVLGDHGARGDEDDIRDCSKGREHCLVSSSAEPARDPIYGDCAVETRNHVRDNPWPVSGGGAILVRDQGHRIYVVHRAGEDLFHARQRYLGVDRFVGRRKVRSVGITRQISTGYQQLIPFCCTRGTPYALHTAGAGLGTMEFRYFRD